MRDAIIALSLKVSEEAAPLRIDAAVVRYVGEETAGVEFLRWPPGERERLQQLMRGLLIEREV